MTRQHWSKGAVVEILLSGGQIVEAQMLDEPEFAFFHPKERSEVLFRLWVHKSAYTDGRWRKTGKAQVPSELGETVDRFMQDAITGNLSIYRDQSEIPGRLEECLHLERAAVWDPEHVESRLEDHLAGRPNKWVESLKIDKVKLTSDNR